MVPNEEVLEVLEAWGPSSLELDRVNFVSGVVDGLEHPLVFNHPVTGRPTMFYGLGSLSAARYTRGGVEMSKAETTAVKAAIQTAIERVGITAHKWQQGDLLMMDNHAMAHRAAGGSQAQPQGAGLRLIRRVTMAGKRRLQRRSPVDATLLNGPLFPRRCSDQLCLVSLARWTQYIDDGRGLFASLAESRELCKYALHASADLVELPTKALAAMAAELVAETAVPHWILGTENASNPTIEWPNQRGGGPDEWGDGGYPWHEESGQPNDCDGQDSEPCIFVGPEGRWFDFACDRKTAEGTTPGPEITWTTGVRKMYNLHPLCVVDKNVVDSGASGYGRASFSTQPRMPLRARKHGEL